MTMAIAGPAPAGPPSPSRPMNVEQIVKEAQNFDYNPHIPLKYWFRTAGTLLKEAEIYEQEGNEQQTYLLLFRHAQLVLRNLSSHPDARLAQNRAPLAQAERDVERGLAKMEILKPRINRKFERYEKTASARFSVDRTGSQQQHYAGSLSSSAGGQHHHHSLLRKPQRKQSADDSGGGVLASSGSTSSPPHKTLKKLRGNDPAVAGTAAIPASDNKDFAVRLAHSEIKRRALARKATRQAGISEEVEAERRTAGVWGGWEEELIGKGKNGSTDDRGGDAASASATDATTSSPSATSSSAGPVDVDALSRQMQRVRMQVDGRTGAGSTLGLGQHRRTHSQEMSPQQQRENEDRRPSNAPSVVGSRLSYKYPTIPHATSNGTETVARTEPPAKGLVQLLKAPSAPLAPPKDRDRDRDGSSSSTTTPTPRLKIPPPPPPPRPSPSGPPPRPDKQPLAELESPAPSPTATNPSFTSLSSTPPQTSITPSSSLSSSASNAATAAAEPKARAFTFQPSAYLENGQPLRTIFLPPDLRGRFLRLARHNTARNLETCGILCGTLISNALFVSRLVVPRQKSTSDTCEMVDESALFDYVDGEDLLVLGWIHTHPTQTCFMSSRDLHTHCGYQVMMPESIAIVCAPSRNEWGVFRLTDPPGMKTILNCTQSGLFHPHDAENIYTDALRPGHVFEAKGLEFDVHDMRDDGEGGDGDRDGDGDRG